MTLYGEADSPGQMAPIRMDSLDLTKINDAVLRTLDSDQLVDETNRFWASVQRPIDSPHREILAVHFGSERLINHLSFKVSRFPLVLSVEYLDKHGDWQPVTYAKKPRKKVYQRKVKKTPVRLLISESTPRRVNSARQTGSKQHFGEHHWADEHWRITPIKTRKIRFIFVRNHRGDPPRNHHNHPVPYSVALRHLQIGYRVLEHDHIPDPPPTAEDWWASSRDIFGSQVVYSTYEQPAWRAIDGDPVTYWRSEPQPFPFAVVPFYLDCSDANGNTQVIDRFWVDPVTSGVLCNVYYSDDRPGTDFKGSSEPIPAANKTEVGNPLPVHDDLHNLNYAISFGPTDATGVSVDNSLTRFRYDLPWWVGVDLSSLVDTTDTTERPILSMGTTRLFQDGAQIKLMSQTGETAVVDLDPAVHQVNTHFLLVAAYFPRDYASPRPPYFRLVYQVEGFDPVVVEQAVADLDNVESAIRVGLHPDPLTLDPSAMDLRGLVVKSEGLSDDTQDWFLEEGADYVANPITPEEYRGTSQNARVRVHPDFLGPTNPFGIVGGPGEQFSDMVWTPITRDYSLRQGYMHLPPTKARYWKFELTGLLPQIYDNFISIERDVLVFPPDVVALYQATVGIQDSTAAPSGVATTANVSEQVVYKDVLETDRPTINPVSDATHVLVVKDPVQAQKVASNNGWIWSYQPWHIGSSAPSFPQTGQHHYESITVRHSTKVAFFAGIKEIRPFRVDYTFNDDTPEYVEHLLDDAYIDSYSGVERWEGGVRALGNTGEITSMVLSSYLPVRGVQFASQETDSVQILDDPKFTDPTFSFWTRYGDASVQRIGDQDVSVNRQWIPYTYGDLETMFPSYGDMEDRKYAQLEGNAQASGYAEGGLISGSFFPSGAGKIVATAKISSPAVMSGPVVLEIVSAYDDSVVAAQPKWVQIGQTVDLRVAYNPGPKIVFRTYGEVETLVSNPTTYGELEAFRYYEIESAEADFHNEYYLRIRQRGPASDSFHIHEVNLYDDPIAWDFSNDGGLSWWKAVDVRNDPHGVLIFPEAVDTTDPAVGRSLMWRARLYREDATITALNIRPWYGNRLRTAEPIYALESSGPNQNLLDVYPPIHKHPMWVGSS